MASVVRPPGDGTAPATPCDAVASGRTADLTWGLSIASCAYRRWAQGAVADLPGGLRGYLVLSTVARGLPRSQLALAHQLDIDKTAMTYLLDALQAAGLIERHPDPADRRARQLLITPAGVAALEKLSARLDSVGDTLLAPLGPDEAAAFGQMLQRVALAAQTALECSGDAPAGTADPGACL